jgi:hypothetical protein
MGLIKDFLKSKKLKAPRGNYSAAEVFTGYSPVFTSWGGQVFESELVREAIHAKARHAGKLKFTMQGSAHGALRRAMQYGPNELNTWPQFLERCMNIYDVQNNLIIIPILDDFDEIAGYWPVYPSACEVREADGVYYVVFQFASGKTMAMELTRCGIITKYQLKNDFFGENNAALTPTMELVNMVNQGIIEGVKNSASYRFMAQVDNFMFDEDLRKEGERFDRLNFINKSGGGVLLMNANWKNIKQLEPGKSVIDAKQQELIEKNVHNYFGVSEEIIQNTAGSEKMNAFYDGEIEPFALKLSEALTRMTFTQRERSQGNEILFTSNRLQYMSVSEKVNLSKELGDRGAILIDEIRELFNYPPLENGAGQHAPIRGEYYMADEGKGGGKNA